MPDLDDGNVHAADCLVLERAEFNNIRTLAYVLAQTVALHFYETCVPLLLQQCGCKPEAPGALLSKQDQLEWHCPF